MSESTNPLNLDCHKQLDWLSQLQPDESCFIPLEHAAVLVIEGPDAQKFLQGQCTCDVSQTTEKSFLLGAHCNPQGRMLGSFTILRLATEKFALRLHKSIAEALLADLKKYSIFSKATLSLDTNFTCLGVYAPQVPALFSSLGISGLETGEQRVFAGGRALRLDEQQYELWFDRTFIENNTSLFAAEIFCAEHQWDLLNIRRGVADVRTQTRAEFLPQEFNFQLINGVSFKKGCYTGQEIIARIHYKGKLKKHMHRARVDATASVQPGTELLIQEKNVGKVLLSAPLSPSACEILALCQDSATQEENVQISMPPGSFLRWQALPYAIPG